MSNKNQPESQRKKGAIPAEEPAARNPELPNPLRELREREKAEQKAVPTGPAPKGSTKPVPTHLPDDGDEEMSAEELEKLEADDFEDDSEED